MDWLYSEIAVFWVIYTLILSGTMFFVIGFVVGREKGAKDLDKIKLTLMSMKTERTNIDDRLEVISDIITDIQKGSE